MKHVRQTLSAGLLRPIYLILPLPTYMPQVSSWLLGHKRLYVEEELGMVSPFFYSGRHGDYDLGEDENGGEIKMF